MAVPGAHAELQLRPADLDAEVHENHHKGTKNTKKKNLIRETRSLYQAPRLNSFSCFLCALCVFVVKSHRKPSVQVIHDPMKSGQVNRFNHAHVVQENMQVLLGELLQFAAAKARAAEGFQPVAIRPLHRHKDIGAIARPADGNEQIAGASQVFELLDEDALEPLVVTPSENIRRVVGQAEDAQA